MNTVECDDLDKVIMKRLTPNTLRNVLKRQKEARRELYEDTFLGLYKPFPELVSEESLEDKDSRLNRKIMEHIMQSREYEKSRRRSVLDPGVSGMASVNVVWKILNEMGSNPQYQSMQNRRDQLENELQQDQQQPGQGQPGDGDGEDSDGDGDEEGNNQGGGGSSPSGGQGLSEEEAEAKYNREQDLQNQIDDLENQMAESLANSASDAIDEANKTTKALDNLIPGWSDSGPDTRLPDLQEVMRVMNAFGEGTFRFLDLLGRLTNYTRSRNRRKESYVPQEIDHIGFGDNIPDVLPEEFADYLNEDTEVLFLHKFANQALMEFEYIGPNAGRGPLIVCIDYSGSMEGDRIIWAVATGLAIMRWAIHRNRKVYFVPFGDSATQHEITEDRDLMKLMDGKSFNVGGGTNFDRVLYECLAILEHKEPNADILFISDAGCWPGDEVVEEIAAKRKQNDLSVISVHISGMQDPVLIPHEDPESLVRFSDTVIPFHDVVEHGDEVARRVTDLLI